MLQGLLIVSMLFAYVYFRLKRLEVIKHYVSNAYPDIFKRLSEDKMKIGANRAFISALEESIQHGELSQVNDETLQKLMHYTYTSKTEIVCVLAALVGFVIAAFV